MHTPLQVLHVAVQSSLLSEGGLHVLPEPLDARIEHGAMSEYVGKAREGESSSWGADHGAWLPQAPLVWCNQLGCIHSGRLPSAKAGRCGGTVVLGLDWQHLAAWAPGPGSSTAAAAASWGPLLHRGAPDLAAVAVAAS